MKKREQETPWIGLGHVLEHGLPGYPAPRLAEPPMEPAPRRVSPFSFSSAGDDQKESLLQHNLAARLEKQPELRSIA